MGTLDVLRRASLYSLAGDIRLVPLQMSHLEALSQWPRYTEWDMKWANFLPKNKFQRERWYSDNVEPRKMWYIGELLGEGGWSEVVSRISLIEPISGNQVVFGIVIHPLYLGQGLGSSFTRMIARAVYELTDFDGIWLETHHLNNRAQHVYEKVGFTYIGHSFHKGFSFSHDMFYNYFMSRDVMGEQPRIRIQLEES